jgi:nuclear transport factor 2 (NTF2) superfamily protein
MRVLKKSIWPHEVRLRSEIHDNRDPRIDWLTEKLPKDRWYALGPNVYCFKTSQDAVMFSLRWS